MILNSEYRIVNYYGPETSQLRELTIVQQQDDGKFKVLL